MSGHGHRNLHTVCDRFGWKCWYCGKQLRCVTCDPHGKGSMATRDHYVPKSKGGGGGYNLVASCWNCNKRKADGEMQAKRPKARSLGGCQYGRTPRASRHRRPRRTFASFEFAAAMCAAVEFEANFKQVPWQCQGCGGWHIGPEGEALQFGRPA